MRNLTFALAWALSGLACAAVYDGSQSNTVITASVLGAKRATLSFHVQSSANENPTYVVLAEYGRVTDTNSFRVTFNGRRERRICGFYGDTRVYSTPNAIDDGKRHHIAFDIEPGRSMTLYLDGQSVDTATIPDRGFASGPLAIAQRVELDSAGHVRNTPRCSWSRFRGAIDNVALAGDGAAANSQLMTHNSQLPPHSLQLPPSDFQQSPTWECPKTTRRYLHGPFSERC